MSDYGLDLRGGFLGLLAAMVFAGASILLIEMAIWGWSVNVQVPDWVIAVSVPYGMVCGWIGWSKGSALL